MYSKSSNISVFPLAKSRNLNITDGEIAPFDRHLTEANISNLVRQLIDKPGFVISFSTNDDGTVNISFNLYGYYFNVKNLAVNSIGDAVFASIAISKDDISGQYEISGQDEIVGVSSCYKGVEFTSSEPDKNKISLKILEKVNDIWGVPVDSWVKLTTQSFTIGGINGKYK